MEVEKNQNLLESGKVLPIMEAFYTIQGEGNYSGTAAYFIRTAGCDIGCHWCDVKESWDSNSHPLTAVDDIVEDIRKYAKTVVITGGEPLIWSLDYITEQLQKNRIKTHIETSGAYSISGIWDWFCLSPKKIKLPLEKSYLKADELKVIIYNKNDFIFAESQANKVGQNCLLFLQPEWTKREKMLPLIIDYVLENPKWKISLQTHKYLNIP